MLENDIVLTRFLDARGDGITDAEITALDRLLDLSDNELWDILAGRTDVDDDALQPLVAALRAA